MVCMTDMALLHDYFDAAEDFYNEVKRLNRPLRHKDFERVLEDVRQARARCVRAREMLEEHRREHGCRREGC